MKKTLCILLAIVLVLSCSACRSQEDKIYDELIQQSPTVSSEGLQPEGSAATQSSGEKHLSGELRISCCFSDTLEVWVDEFEAAYPDVTVTVEEAFDLENRLPSDWGQQYAQAAVVDLVSGESADIVDVSILNFYKHAKSGLFMDYYELMENDPGFRREDYYTNIFQALEAEDGALYALPPFYSYNMLVLNDYMLQQIEPETETNYKDGIGWKDMVELFQKGREIGAIPEGALFANQQNKLFFDGFVFAQFMDEKAEEARFDSPAFIEYLEKTDALPFDRKVGGSVTYTTDMPEFTKANFFCQQLPVSTTSFRNITMNEMPEGVSNPFFYRDAEGNAPFSASSLWAIPKGGNTELAWEFMKFMVEEKEFPKTINPESPNDIMEYYIPYVNSIPINRQNFLNLYGAGFDKGLVEEVDAYCQTLNARMSISSELMSNLMEIMENYYNSHLISAEECAKQMQDRAWIYLNE